MGRATSARKTDNSDSQIILKGGAAISAASSFALVGLQIFHTQHQPVSFIGESIGAIHLSEHGVTLQDIKADAPLQFAQANRTKMQWAPIRFD